MSDALYVHVMYKYSVQPSPPASYNPSIDAVHHRNRRDPGTYVARVPSYALYTVTFRCIIIVVLAVLILHRSHPHPRLHLLSVPPQFRSKDKPPALATHPRPDG